MLKTNLEIFVVYLYAHTHYLPLGKTLTHSTKYFSSNNVWSEIKKRSAIQGTEGYVAIAEKAHKRQLSV